MAPTAEMEQLCVHIAADLHEVCSLMKAGPRGDAP
jgi:hypothetical protein